MIPRAPRGVDWGVSQGPEKPAYARSGVSLEAGERTLELVSEAVRATYDERVLAGLGAFGGVYDLSFLTGYTSPVLVASTDGVGTKTLLAAALGRYHTLGYDLVHHGVNDILAQGATPLFFMDYLAAARLEPEVMAAVIDSVAAACREAGIVLLGGETAEMPGVYREGALDLAGTIVGVCERSELVTGSSIVPGDTVFALASGGLQTNGYSLARSALEGHYHEPLAGGTVGEALLAPHRHYLEPVRTLRQGVAVKGMAHVTGGGIPGNLPRILPAGLGAEIDLGSWPRPEIFDLIRQRAGVEEAEMYRVFNMGAGFLLVVDGAKAEAVPDACPEPIYRVGRIVEGGGVRLG